MKVVMVKVVEKVEVRALVVVAGDEAMLVTGKMAVIKMKMLKILGKMR